MHMAQNPDYLFYVNAAQNCSLMLHISSTIDILIIVQIRWWMNQTSGKAWRWIFVQFGQFTLHSKWGMYWLNSKLNKIWCGDERVREQSASLCTWMRKEITSQSVLDDDSSLLCSWYCCFLLVTFSTNVSYSRELVHRHLVQGHTCQRLPSSAWSHKQRAAI